MIAAADAAVASADGALQRTRSLRRMKAAVERDEAAAGRVVDDAVVARARLRQQAEALDLPPAALDIIIDELGGPTAVAEMTGRKGRMVREGGGGGGGGGKVVVFKPRAKPESAEMEQLNVHERSAFKREEARRDHLRRRLHRHLAAGRPPRAEPAAAPPPHARARVVGRSRRPAARAHPPANQAAHRSTSC